MATGGSEKSGVPIADLTETYKAVVAKCKFLRLRGLMCVGVYG
eukprot:SAG31_NODE_20009_length_586_cov_0.944559_1_plen_42_part_10